MRFMWPEMSHNPSMGGGLIDIGGKKHGVRLVTIAIPFTKLQKNIDVEFLLIDSFILSLFSMRYMLQNGL